MSAGRRVLAFQTDAASIPTLLDSLLVNPVGVDTIADAETISALQAEIATRHGKLATVQGRLLSVRLAEPRPTPDRLLTPDEAAERLGTTTEWVYKNWKTKLPFGIKVSPKQLRFSERRLERFLAMREAA